MLRSKHMLILSVFVILSMFAMQPSKFLIETVEIGDVSHKDFFAPESLTYEDELATQKIIQEKLSESQSVYISDEKVSLSVIEEVETFINAIIDSKMTIANKVNEAETLDPNIDVKTITKETLEKIKNPYSLNYEQLTSLYTLDEKTLRDMLDITKLELVKVFENKITDENLASIQKDFMANTAFYMFPSSIRPYFVKGITEKVQINLFLDTEQTEKNKAKTKSSVEPVLKAIKKGELVLATGEVITEEHYYKLEKLGLINVNFDFVDILKKLPFIMLTFTFLHIYLLFFYPTQFDSLKRYTYVLTGILIVILCDSFLTDSYIMYLPFLLIMMVFSMFWGKTFVIFTAGITGLLVSNGDYIQFSLFFITGIVISLKFDREGEGVDLIRSGVIVGLYLLLSCLVIEFTFGQNFSFDFYNPILMFLSSLFAAGGTFVVVGFSERYLNLVTSPTLHSLTKPSKPLLKQLQINASGTYKHSLDVANLAELGAEEIGANSLLLRVASYYHDVGKMKNPEFFIENSTPSSNPHDAMDPIDSARIILEHPLLSIEMCREYKIPEPVIAVIASHHGDSILQHFYSAAKESDPNIDINLFTYQTPTPKSKEEGILMLADSCEAYSRVISDKPKEEFEKLLRESIYKKIHSGLLKDCELTVNEIYKITNKFIEYLVRSNHKRIEYVIKEETSSPDVRL